LYEEAIFLKYNFKGAWVIENVEPYYDPLIQPVQIGRHMFWSNFPIKEMKDIPHFQGFMTKQNVAAKKALQDWLGIHYDKNIYYGTNHCVTQVLRNCVHPDLGLHVFRCMKDNFIIPTTTKKYATVPFGLKQNIVTFD
jgi:DNA (cytosine-5)-methyltransferase 1